MTNAPYCVIPNANVEIDTDAIIELDVAGASTSTGLGGPEAYWDALPPAPEPILVSGDPVTQMAMNQWHSSIDLEIQTRPGRLPTSERDLTDDVLVISTSAMGTGVTPEAIARYAAMAAYQRSDYLIREKQAHRAASVQSQNHPHLIYIPPSNADFDGEPTPTLQNWSPSPESMARFVGFNPDYSQNFLGTIRLRPRASPPPNPLPPLLRVRDSSEPMKQSKLTREQKQQRKQDYKSVRSKQIVPRRQISHRR